MSFEFKRLGRCDYREVYDEMRSFTNARKTNKNLTDQVWVLEHHPVITLGTSANEGDVSQYKGKIDIVRTDRGGKATYHGPGQLIVYFLFDLKNRSLKVKSFINLIENIILESLHSLGIKASLLLNFPGIYVDTYKIASFGLSLNSGFTYHGFSLNVNMDLSPFSQIIPCGNSSFKMANVVDFAKEVTFIDVQSLVEKKILEKCQ